LAYNLLNKNCIIWEPQKIMIFGLVWGTWQLRRAECISP